ncbi:protein phosphatase 2A, regulatory subunit PR55 [Actinidia rufa]|uniref:Protein phosphatase 2A, regulatory subunit PR55 n=1 Tax=Actinidia rufa TaxID=165716 RepID=A0A7J0FYX1_9ERIC|nr:protein phosphatase 2A, regulatory subunit PR55 [Actinidia rufa]
MILSSFNQLRDSQWRANRELAALNAHDGEVTHDGEVAYNGGDDDEVERERSVYDGDDSANRGRVSSELDLDKDQESLVESQRNRTVEGQRSPCRRSERQNSRGQRNKAVARGCAAARVQVRVYGSDTMLEKGGVQLILKTRVTRGGNFPPYKGAQTGVSQAMWDLDFDVISAIEFEKSGDYLAVGDRGGCVVIFERKANNNDLGEYYTQNELEQLDFLDAQHPQFQYKTEFQSHEPEVANIGDGAPVRCRKVYAHAHDFNINSISNNSDGETFVSADDLRVNLWNLEVIDQCFNIIDMKPTNMDDLTEVITSAEFHPLHCNLLAYSSSRGFIRLVDMRQSALCDHSARILQDGESRGSKSFFTEIIASISDIKFATEGRHILMSGLNVNYVKLEISPVGKAGNVGSLASVVGYKVGDVASTYLGLPLGSTAKAKAIWGLVVEGFQKRLSG